ncbi:MAG: hypothetical protein IJ572_00510 [Bacilli bacterium]|nr:hypothetical protein [Bacilli bacterium]
MVVYDIEKLRSKVLKIDKDELYINICKTIKKLRKERYNEFKKLNTSKSINPYTTESIAELLDYNHTHYKRFESETDATKQIPLEKIVKLALIFDVSIDEIINPK